jgi:hypothetical protein
MQQKYILLLFARWLCGCAYEGKGSFCDVTGSDGDV